MQRVPTVYAELGMTGSSTEQDALQSQTTNIGISLWQEEEIHDCTNEHAYVMAISYSEIRNETNHTWRRRMQSRSGVRTSAPAERQHHQENWILLDVYDGYQEELKHNKKRKFWRNKGCSTSTLLLKRNQVHN